MVVELLIGVTAFVAGAKAAWKLARGDKNRCKAFDESKSGMAQRRCLEQAYHHCESGFCIIHCREEKRCSGTCVTERQRILRNV